MKPIGNHLGLVLAIGLTSIIGIAGGAWSADCGDGSGPGGTDVPCACGDRVTSDTVLDNSDPVVSTGPTDVCPGLGLKVGGGVTSSFAIARFETVKMASL